MSASIYGDVIPYTPLEQFYTSIITLLSRLFLAFLYGEISSFMSSYYKVYIDHVNKTALMVEWLKYNNCGHELVNRTKKYREILWQKCKGIDDQLLIMDMPESLRKKVQLAILEHLVNNADVIPKNDNGSVLSIIQKLTIQRFPAGEYIIHKGELGFDMYFLIEGTVDIYVKHGIKVVSLTTGKCFGEMAILNETPSKRTASVRCATDVSVAVFKKEDFDLICEMYPSFKERIAEIVQKRNQQNKIVSKQILSPKKSNLNNKVIINQEKNVSKPIADPNASIDIPNKTTIKWLKVLCFIYKIIRILVCFYNIIFIPLQMAFRIDYDLKYYIFEGITLAIHFIDIGILIRKHRKLSFKIFPKLHETDQNKDKIIPIKGNRMSNSELRKKRIRLMICLEVFTCIPWSVILQNIHSPIYLIFIIKMFRIMKIWPMSDFLDKLKKCYPNTIRVCESFMIYTVVAHIMACAFILMIYVAETKNESWVKRVPYPIPDIKGFRVGNNMTGVADTDIYVHAIYFSLGALTHIGSGDVCAVNINERILKCVLIFISFHIFMYLFVNITSMVTDLFGGIQNNLQENYEETLKEINVNSLPEHITARIRNYYEDLWLSTGGLKETIISDLPDNLKTDIQLEIYKKAITNSVLFKRPNMKFNEHAASSFLRLSKIEKYMKGDILLKAGSLSSRLFFLLDGELILIGINKAAITTVLPGALLNTTIKSGVSRQLVYVVATKVTTVAIINESDLDIFFRVFPNTKEGYEYENELMLKEYIEVTIPQLLDSHEDEMELENLLENVILCINIGIYERK